MFSFCCTENNCRGFVQDNGKCKVCDIEMDVDTIKVEVEKLKERIETVRVALENVEDKEANRKNLDEITSIWRR